MELEGRLNSALTLPEVLQFLSMGKMTGYLTVGHGSDVVTLSLRNGKLVNSSNTHRARKLGQLLVCRGLVDRQTLEEALRYQKELQPPIPLGRILLQRHLISYEQLRQALRLQLEEEMWDLFALQEGTFKFEHADENMLGDVMLDVDIEPVILEGTRRLDEWTRIIKNVPGDEAVPAVRAVETGFDRELMTFSDNEWRVLSLINGFYNVGSIANRSGIGRFETYRILNSFLAAGYVEVRCAPTKFALPGNGARQQAPPEAEADNGSKPVGSSSARLMALLGIRSEGAEEPPPPRREEPRNLVFSSPVGFVAGLANYIAEELFAKAEFASEETPGQLALHYWRTNVMHCPKADLLQMVEGRFETKRFERFVEVHGMEEPFRSCYDDTLEALARYLKMLFLLAAQRLGAGATQKLFGELFQSYRSRSVIQRSEEFYFQDYAKKVYG